MPKAPPPQKPQGKIKANWILRGRVITWSCLFAGAAWGGMKTQGFLKRDARFELACDAARPVCANLEIHGAQYTKRARIQTLFSADFGKSVFQIPLEARWGHLLAIDWVRTASVTRVWPNKIVVTITERQPVAFAKLPIGTGIAQNGSGSGTRHFMALIDRDGVLMTLPPKVRFSLPVLSGVNEDQSDDDRRLRVAAMQHLLEDLGPQAKDVSEVNAASTQDLRVTAEVDRHGVELWLGDQHFRSRMANFASHYQEIRVHSPDAGVFDLRLDDRILAR